MTSSLDITVNAGNREAVLLIHGLTGAPDEMRYVAKKLSDKGFDVYGPLLAGHGAGYPELIATNWHDWLETVTDAYDAISQNYDKIHVAGICVGGMLGMLLGQRRRIATCAVYSPLFHFDGWAMKRRYAVLPLTWPLTHLPILKRTLVPETYPFGLKDERLRNLAAHSQTALIRGALGAMPLSSLAHMYRLGQAVLKAAPRLCTPTLILHAEEDDLGHKRNAFMLKDALGDNAEVVLLNNSYHMIHVDQERAKVAQLTATAFQHAGRIGHLKDHV